MLADEELVQKAQQGDQEALMTLLRQAEAPLYRTAYYILGNEQDALDMTQEALIRIFHNIGRFRQEARFKTWAQRIITNLCFDLCRRRQNQAVLSLDQHRYLIEQQQYSHVEQVVEHALFKSELEEAIGRLSEAQRAVVVLRYLHDFTYREIAEALDLPLNTVKSHLYRARQALHRHLISEGSLAEGKGGVHR